MNTTLLFNNLSSLVSFVYNISSKPEIPIKLWAAIDENLNKVLFELQHSNNQDIGKKEKLPSKIPTNNLTPDDLESLEINDEDEDDDQDDQYEREYHNEDNHYIKTQQKNQDILLMINRYNEKFQYFSKVLNDLTNININETNNDNNNNNNNYSLNEFKIKLKYSLLMIEILLEIVKSNPIDFQISLNVWRKYIYIYNSLIYIQNIFQILI